jgi:hypothetical protein
MLGGDLKHDCLERGKFLSALTDFFFGALALGDVSEGAQGVSGAFDPNGSNRYFQVPYLSTFMNYLSSIITS